jgi:predicted anti-sigma-YlaC factor YlaD
MMRWGARVSAWPVKLVTVTCAEATRLASARLDEPLPLAGRLRLSVHLVICKWCRRYTRQIALLRRIARCAAEAPAAGTAAPALGAEARARMKAALTSR